MRLNFKNNAYAVLAANITSTATSLTVESAALLPDVPFRLTILDSSVKHGAPVEIIEVSAKSGTTLSSITRGLEGTTKQAHTAGVRLENRITAGAVEEIPHTKADIGLGNVDNVKQATTDLYTVTLDTTWSGSGIPGFDDFYAKIQTVTGIKATDNPIVDIVLTGDPAIDEELLEEWAKVYRIATLDDTIGVCAKGKPTVSLPIQLKVVR